MTIQLGPHTLENPYWLAPMAGITNAPFRLLMREVGAGLVVSELISATGIQYKGRKTLELCQVLEDERPVGLQIFGEDEEHLALAAHVVEKRGADFVDINMGCPVPKIVRKGGGAAMLQKPEELFRVLSRVKREIKVPLTVKIRTGWDADSINAHEVVAAAADAGVAWVAIHGRTRAQGYEGSADWELIAQVKARARVPIIGNGDILTAEQAILRLKESGCDAVMIGRGALRDPFLFRRIAMLEGRTVKADGWDYWKLINRHLELMREALPEYYAGVQLRKFMTWYSAGIEGSSQFRRALYAEPNTTEGLNAVIELGRQFFDRPGLEKQDSFLKEPFLKGGHG